MRIQEQVENLCDICKFSYKCDRFQKITNTLFELESLTLNTYRMDVLTGFSVQECDLFKSSNSSDNYSFSFYLDDLPDSDKEE